MGFIPLVGQTKASLVMVKCRDNISKFGINNVPYGDRPLVYQISFFLNGKTAGSRPQSHITVSCVQFGIARGRMSTGSRLLKLEWFCFLVCSSWKRFLVWTAQTQGSLIKLSDAAELVPVPPTPTDTDRVFQWRKITQSQTKSSVCSESDN